MLAYQQGRSHTDFLCRLRDYWPHYHLFQNGILEQLSTHFALIKTDELEKIAHRNVTNLIELY